VLLGKTRRHLGEIYHALARQKECQILDGHLMPYDALTCIAIPPKHPVVSVIEFLKEKSAIAVGRLCGKERNFTGEHLWARGYACPRPGSSWSKSANASANRKKRMEAADNFESMTKARLGATPKLTGDRL
jgi:hypothetical protein